jgi:type II secretory pathway component GspD/PulD (secretin)
MNKGAALGLVAVLGVCSWAQVPPDVKFYELEKEYRRTITYIYEVKNTQALELKQIVADMLSIYGTVYVNEKTNELYITDVEEKIGDLREILPGLDIDGLEAGNNLATEVVYLKHENASSLIELIRHKLSADGTLQEVPYLNALSITDIPSKITEVRELLTRLDVPGPHIGIEITVVEFNDEEFSKLGVNLFNWLQGLGIRADMHGDNPGDLINNASYTVGSRTEPRPVERGALLDQKDREMPQHLTAEFNIADLVGFICDNADGSVLANTRIVTRNNKEALISSKEVIPYRHYENDEAFRDRNQRMVSAGVYVRVLPTLQEDSLINLRIAPVVSDLTGWSPKGMPIIFERSLLTEVKVKEGAVFVLGGLKKREAVEVRRGIPVLKEIPILQYLFSVKQRDVVEREVLIFIRPSTRIDTDLSAAQVDTVLQRYRRAVGRRRRSRFDRRRGREVDSTTKR